MELKIGVEGMSCGGCVLSVEKALGRVAGVKKVTVSLEKKEAVVDAEGVDRATLVRAVEDAGYDAR
jgi:copper ion binding protein